MRQALIFISYHPGPLPQLDRIREACPGKWLSVLVICEHPYLNAEIIETYSKRFGHTIVLPLVKYEANIFRGLWNAFHFLRRLKNEMRLILKGVDRFYLISNFSAYLPVNIILSWLQKNPKCEKLISISEEDTFKRNYSFVKSIFLFGYTVPLRLFPVGYDPVLKFMYLKDHRDVILRICSPYGTGSEIPKGNKKIYRFVEKIQSPSGRARKNLIIIYGDTTARTAFVSDLDEREYENRLTCFYSALSEAYRGCKFIYKPHPSDNFKLMPGVKKSEVEIYRGGVTSQMHLDLLSPRIRACYSVSSTSLIYAAERGIPSYTLYRYLEFKGEYPKGFFENDKIRNLPFLYNMQDPKEIGAIDDLTVEPSGVESQQTWHEVFQQIPFHNNR